MKPIEFASAVVDILQAEKESFIEMMQNNEWEAIRDEIEEYAKESE